MSTAAKVVNAIQAWCGAHESRRERAANAIDLGPLYKAGSTGEAATARVWYGIGALGYLRADIVLSRLEDALTPSARDVIDEAMAPNANAFGRGLMAEAGATIESLSAAWMTADRAARNAAASTLNSVWGADDEAMGEAATAAVFHRLGEAASRHREARAEFYEALTGQAPTRRAPATAMQTTLAPWVVDLNLRGEALTMEVLPPPNAEGIIRGDDGRRYRVRDMAALARAINAQEPAPRLDIDHQSEQSSRTFRGSTAAYGWLSKFRVSARGGLEADATLSNHAAHLIRSDGYRYLSPALHTTTDMEITGLSSVALVNNPNFPSLRIRGAAA